MRVRERSHNRIRPRVPSWRGENKKKTTKWFTTWVGRRKRGKQINGQNKASQSPKSSSSSKAGLFSVDLQELRQSRKRRLDQFICPFSRTFRNFSDSQVFTIYNLPLICLMVPKILIIILLSWSFLFCFFLSICLYFRNIVVKLSTNQKSFFEIPFVDLKNLDDSIIFLIANL